MHFLEVRRHSVRDIPQEHLSEAGRRLAAEVGRTRGPFQLVVSSPALRARETAVAMGFPPTQEDSLWYPPADGRFPWPASFREMRDHAERNPWVAELSVQFDTAIRGLLRRLPDGGSMLLVAHGGVPELVAAAWFAPEVLERLGPPCRCMEGILVSVREGKGQDVEVLRVPDDRTRI